ncbi:MAG: alpha/beta hydrolase [Anaerolineales bacterium]|nr:alpha/beta hydrolase [Anaerolineales bacterium]
MKKFFRTTLALLFIVTLFFAGGVLYWNSQTYLANDIALQALQSDAQVIVAQHDGFVAFVPVGKQALTGVIFYPGAGVDHRAYAPTLHQIAAQGYVVALLRVPLNLAFFDVDAADRVMTEYPQIERWAVGGHSLGGVAASEYAAKNVESVSGLILWASYPAGDSLAATNLPALSIYGTNDMAGVERFVQSQSQLPADAQFVVIEGGNHSQFGSYGLQNGDNPATISAEEQWSQTAEATAQFLMSLAR